MSNIPPEYSHLTEQQLKEKVKRQGTLPLPQQGDSKLVNCPQSGEVCKICPENDPRPLEFGEILTCSGPITGNPSPPIQGCRYHPDRHKKQEQEQQPVEDSGLPEPAELIQEDKPANTDTEPIPSTQTDTIDPGFQDLIHLINEIFDEPQNTEPELHHLNDADRIQHVFDRGGAVELPGGRYLVKCPEHDDAICGLYPVPKGGGMEMVCTGPNPGWFQDTKLFGLIKSQPYTSTRQPYDSCAFHPDHINPDQE